MDKILEARLESVGLDYLWELHERCFCLSVLLICDEVGVCSIQLINVCKSVQNPDFRGLCRFDVEYYGETSLILKLK
jgi:hypothetical protein